MIKKYTSQFADVKGHTWQVTITRRMDDAPGVETVEDFRFGLQPIMFSYSEVTKYDPIMTTACTLSLESPDDRTFVDLYAEGPGDCCVHVYRDGELYYTGILDPELYAEPYATERGYLVELTFSDMGQLKRLPFKLSGGSYLSVVEYIERAAREAGLRLYPLDNIVTIAPPVFIGADVFCDGSNTTVGKAGAPQVLTDNFLQDIDPADDDSRPTWYDVLGWLLQPLCYRLVQSWGRLTLCHLYQQRKFEAAEIAWADVDAQMDTDKVYNKLTLKIDSRTATLCDATIDPDTHTLGGDVAGPLTVALDQEVAQYDVTADSVLYPRPVGFSLTFGTEMQPQPLMGLYGAREKFARYFIQRKAYSGSDCAGIMCLAGYEAKPDYTNPQYKEGYTLYQAPYAGLSHYNAADRAKMGTDVEARNRLEALAGSGLSGNYRRADSQVRDVGLFYLPALRINSRTGYDRQWLRICVDLLMDARYNPYENYGDAGVCQFINIPCLLYFVGDNGKVYYIRNYDYIRGGDYQAPQWEVYYQGTNPDPETNPAAYPGFGHYWLCYYNKGDYSKNNSGGWMTNGLSQGPVRKGSMRKDRQRLNNGAYVPLPPCGGKLHFAVGAGVHMQTDRAVWVSLDHNKISWLAFKDVRIEYADADGSDYDDEEIELSAELQARAEDSLSLELRCCAPARCNPVSAAGYYLNGAAFDRYRLSTATATGHNIEDFLLKSLASQYDRRHIVLHGTVDNDGSLPTMIFTDGAQPADRRFLFVGGEYDVYAATTDARFVELSPLEYD